VQQLTPPLLDTPRRQPQLLPAMATTLPVTLDTLIAVKVQFQGHTKKFRIPLRDLGAHVLPAKIRELLQLQRDEEVVFERYSDSASAYVILDSDKPQVYKTLFRAAKAKLKLRLRATVVGEEKERPPVPAPAPAEHAPKAAIYQHRADTTYPQGIPQASPVIAHSPLPPPPLSTYRKPEVETVQDSPVSPIMSHKADSEGEAPVPRPFTARGAYFAGLANASHNADLAFRPKENTQCSWVVFCNNCNNSMEDVHFHCGICDHGDYDLCPACVNAGIHCPGTGHWMVKRFVKNGNVVNSTTERVAPKVQQQTQNGMPGAFMDEKQPVVADVPAEGPDRTCNCCVRVLPEKEFVTCTSCDDYDLCMECHVNNKHGHHPGHAFMAATPETVLPAIADFLCNAGRNVRHSAVCDGCEKFIYGVRHKCLNCPDWDFCSECIKTAKTSHGRHRFVPIYEPLAEPVTTGARHYGIYCDGPLCKDRDIQSYIEGIRYKCAVCHDTDFCANCESLPTNKHNHTHPLIKFKTPVRNVSVTTLNESKGGCPIARLGDQPARKSTATETIPVAPSSNAATQVQTIVDMKPSEETQPKTGKEKIEIRDLLAEPVQEKISVSDLLCTPPVPVEPAKLEPASVPKPASPKSSDELDAHFIRDTIPDGTVVGTGLNFVQVWTLRNPGPNPWPAGCSVRHVGGDNMLNIDNTRPLSQSELASASESNVVGRPVESGEEISFRVMMKAPNREGIAISYWRLKTADGLPFGHRLWCDIKVTNATSPSLAPAQPVPTPASAPAPIDTIESTTSSNTSNLTPHERWHQSKLERLRMLQRAQAHALMAKEPVSERTARLHEETLERLKKMKLHIDEKDNQNRLFEKLEREKMLRIQKVRKAAVERLLETRRKEHEASVAAMQQEKGAESANVPMAQATAELPVDEKPVETEAHTSGMIFPQLEKESPASSTHQAASMEPEAQEIKSEDTAAVAPSEHSDEEFFEDAESVDIRSVSSDDEGFNTDEEYDILDASDEEA